MIKQVFAVENYWKVVVFYDLDYNLFSVVENDLLKIGMTERDVDVVKEMITSGKAKAVTCSNVGRHQSVVVFNPHGDAMDYINSIVHEAEHVKQAMLEAYHVKDMGESPAYTIGYLVGRMWEVFRNLICNRC